MRNLKKFLAMALTMLMVASCFAFASNATFDDVLDHTEAIETLELLGLAKGDGQGNFNPDDEITRVEGALFLTRLITAETDGTSDYDKKNAVNTSGFADAANNYAAAIGFCVENGIIMGYPDGTFRPNDGINVRDMLVFALRSLGYEVTAENYWWSSIQTAKALGLTAGIEDLTDYDAVLNRADVAQILYNTLLAENVDGTTFASDVYGLVNDTFVLTATNTRNFTNNIKIAAKGYIGLSILNGDGTYGKTFYVKEDKIFTPEQIEAGLNEYLGYSFNIFAADELNTILDVKVNDFKVYEGEEIAADRNNLILDEVNYQLTDKFESNLWNAGVANTGLENEFILYSWNRGGNSATNANVFLYDQQFNIVDNRGNIKLYRVTAVNAADFIWNGQYWVSEYYPSYLNYAVLTSGTHGAADAKYTPATEADIINAATYIYGQATGAYAVLSQSALYTSATSTPVYSMANPYSTNAVKYGSDFDELVVFDDNGDGVWDRGIYTQYVFAYFESDDDYYYISSVNNKGEWYYDRQLGDCASQVAKNQVTWTGNTQGALPYGTYAMVAINCDGNIDPTAQWWEAGLLLGGATIDVKTVYEWKSGLVTAVDRTASATNATIQINGVDYAYGTYNGNNVKLFGIKDSSKVTNEELAGYYGKYIKYIEENGVIYVVDASAAAPAYFVVEEIRPTTAIDGSLQISGLLVGSGTGIQTLTVQFINDQPASYYVAQYGAAALVQGNVQIAATNNNGTYNLYITNINTKPVAELTLGDARSQFAIVNNNYTWGLANTVTSLPKSFVIAGDHAVTFVNGILHIDGKLVDPNGKIDTIGVSTWDLRQNWLTNSTVLAFVTLNDDGTKVVDYAVGVPQYNAAIEYDAENGFVLWQGNNSSVSAANPDGAIKFVYVYGALNADTWCAANGTETIYFFDSVHTRIGYSTSELFPIDTKYTLLFNMKTGAYENTNIAFNKILGVHGHFYKVRHNTQSTLAGYANAEAVADITEQMTVGYLDHTQDAAGIGGAYIKLAPANYGAATTYIGANGQAIKLFHLAGTNITCVKNTTTAVDYLSVANYSSTQIPGINQTLAQLLGTAYGQWNFTQIKVVFWNDAVVGANGIATLSTPCMMIVAAN